MSAFQIPSVPSYDTRPPQHPNIPDVTLNDPANRRVKVIGVGAGVSGITDAYNIQTRCTNVDYVLYEKNPDIGGTWYDNRYPGCACDVPSHCYALHFAPNPFWPKLLSSAQDIWQYLDRAVTVFGLREYMRFNTKVLKATWDDESSQWIVDLEKTLPDGSKQLFQDTCDFFIYAPGLLNQPKWPDIEGLDTFKGRKIHTARWPSDFEKEQWKGQRVAMIGSGASSVQVVPNMQPYVSQMHVYVRTAVWFAGSLVDGFEQGHAYSPEDIKKFRTDHQHLVDHQKIMESKMNSGWELFFKGHPVQNMVQEMFANRMKDLIKNPKLLEGFLPKFSVGCRRITPGDPYIKAVQEPNVDVHFTPVVKVTPTGVIGGDGSEAEVDTIVCATGFDVSFKPHFPIIGKNGVDLGELWGDDPVAYFGLTVPGFPNLAMHGGPSLPVQNGSPMGSFNTVAKYIVRMINKLQTDNIRTIEPKVSVTEAFAAHTQELIATTVFADDCRSWYKNNDTGKISSVWPGSGLHYMEMLSETRWEDYDIEYRDKKNMFAFLGTGYVRQHRTPGADLAWYLTPANIDPRWIKEIETYEEKPLQNGVNGVNGITNGVSKEIPSSLTNGVVVVQS